MSTARKLGLLALAVVTAMSFMTASAAAAQTAEFINRKQAPPPVSNQHCGNSTNPESRCLAHFAGLMELRVDLGIFGEAHEAECNIEVLLRVNEVGAASVVSVNLTPGQDNCPTVAPACSLPWTASGEEDGPVGIVQSNASACLDPAEGPVCSGNLAFDLVNQTGHYETQFNNASVGLCELDVDLEIEYTNTAHADLAVIHP